MLYVDAVFAKEIYTNIDISIDNIKRLLYNNK